MKRPKITAITLAGAIAAFAVLPISAAAAEDKAAAKGGPPEEACKLSLSVPASVYYRGARSRGYEVFSDLRHQERFQVVVAHRGGPCDFVLTAMSSNLGALRSGSGGSLAYEVKDTGGGRNILSAEFSGSNETQIRGSFRGGQGQEMIDLFVEAPPGQFAPGGDYEDLVMMRVFADEGGQLVVKDQRGVAVRAEVAGVVQVSIGAALQNELKTTTVDLGTLTPGLTRNLGFTARSNMPFEVSMSSLNGGRMKHFRTNAYVPYFVRIGGQRLEVGNGRTSVLQSAATGERAGAYDFDIEIGEGARGALAGQYSDALTVTITTR